MKINDVISTNENGLDQIDIKASWWNTDFFFCICIAFFKSSFKSTFYNILQILIDLKLKYIILYNLLTSKTCALKIFVSLLFKLITLYKTFSFLFKNSQTTIDIHEYCNEWTFIYNSNASITLDNIEFSLIKKRSFFMNWVL